MAESAANDVRYLLSDGLGSMRQAVDDTGAVVAYHEFDPYGNPISNLQSPISPYGFTGEWWQADIGLLHLRARWYAPETGTFLSVDPVESEPPYQYVRGNKEKKQSLSIREALRIDEGSAWRWIIALTEFVRTVSIDRVFYHPFQLQRTSIFLLQYPTLSRYRLEAL